MKHLFDGYAMLVKVEFRDGTVHVQQRFAPASPLPHCRSSLSSSSDDTTAPRGQTTEDRRPPLPSREFRAPACRFVDSVAYREFKRTGQVQYPEFRTNASLLTSLWRAFEGIAGLGQGVCPAWLICECMDPFRHASVYSATSTTARGLPLPYYSLDTVSLMINVTHKARWAEASGSC